MGQVGAATAILTAHARVNDEGVAMELSGSAERQLKDIFDLGNDVVTNDVLNSFQDYIADGFDAFEKYIRDTLYQGGQESTALKMILAVEQLHNLMQESERRTSKKLTMRIPTPRRKRAPAPSPMKRPKSEQMDSNLNP